MDLSIHRLQRFTERYIQYPLDGFDEQGTPIAFFNAFIDFTHLYGVAAAPGTAQYPRRRRGFTAQWVWRRTAEQHQHAPATFELSHSLADYVAMIVVSWMLTLCVHYHRPDLVTSSMWPQKAVEDKILYMSKEQLGFLGLQSPDQMERLVDRLRELPGAFRDVYFHDTRNEPLPDAEEEEEEELKGIALTERFSGEGSSMERQRVASLLSEKFRIPKLAPSTSFAYCVESEWARQQVEVVLGGKEVSSVIQAAVLEEMFLDI